MSGGLIETVDGAPVLRLHQIETHLHTAVAVLTFETARAMGLDAQSGWIGTRVWVSVRCSDHDWQVLLGRVHVSSMQTSPCPKPASKPRSRRARVQK